jgi:phage terminase small subunit
MLVSQAEIMNFEATEALNRTLNDVFSLITQKAPAGTSRRIWMKQVENEYEAGIEAHGTSWKVESTARGRNQVEVIRRATRKYLRQFSRVSP